MVGIGTVLIVLIIMKDVLIIHSNNKYSAWYFHLSYNVDKHVLNNWLNKRLGQTFCRIVHIPKDSH